MLSLENFKQGKLFSSVLCWECDEKVHAANKLANKHQRVHLSTSSSHMPKCDIFQRKHFPFVYCVEDLVYQRKHKEWESCFEKLDLDLKPTDHCYHSEHGKQVRADIKVKASVIICFTSSGRAASWLI